MGFQFFSIKPIFPNLKIFQISILIWIVKDFLENFVLRI